MVKKQNIVLSLSICLLLIQTGSVLSNRNLYSNTAKAKKQRVSIFDAIDAPESIIESEEEISLSGEPQHKEEGKQILEETQAPFRQFLSQGEQGIDKFIRESIDEPGMPEKIGQSYEAPQEESEQNELSELLIPSESLGTDGYQTETKNQHNESSDVKIKTKEVAPSIDQKKELKEQDSEDAIKEELSTDTDLIEFYFEDADIMNLLTQISELFNNVTFITDDIIDPLSPGGKALKGNKISFKTHHPLSKKSAWDLFLTFLDLAGFALVPQSEPGFYRVVTSDRAQRSPVPTFIGTDSNKLPENDQVIRYVYFIQNARVETIKDIVTTLKSQSAHAIILQEIKALVITDRSYNIRTLMEIVHELDQVSMPQSMSVLKLVSADASDVKALYDSITKSDEQQQPTKLFATRKQPTALYFPENTRMIAEPRTNSLIIFGSADAIKKIEDFIKQYIDVELEKPYSPLHTYHLRYANAVTIADIMNNMTQFGTDSAAGKTGGVRGGDKYLKPMTFTPEPSTNTLIIKGDYEDFLKATAIIKKLDEPQPQVAVEALILTLDFEDQKELGTQIRNRVPESSGLLGNNVAIQTSGIRLGGTPKGIITNNNGKGSDRLLGNLINLVVDAVAGNTVVSLGADVFGVWGIFGILQTIANTQVVSNPFLVATNKTKATVSVGEVRRVVTSTVYAGTNPADALGDFEAQLKLEVTPQINSDGMIVLKLNVLFENFVSLITDDQEVAKQTRVIDTRTIVADKEVIAIGGLIQNVVMENLTKVPVLGDIPILGWLFKNKRKDIVKRNLLILISTRIIEPEVTEVVDAHTQLKLRDYYETVEGFHDPGERRDPVYKRFFDNKYEGTADIVEDFLFNKIEADKEPLVKKQTKKERVSRSEKARKQRQEALQSPAEPNDGAQNKNTKSDHPVEYSKLLKMMNHDRTENTQLAEQKPTKRRDARRNHRIDPHTSIGVTV